MRIYFVLFALSSLFLQYSANAQQERFGKNQYIHNGDTLNYRMLFPDADTLRKYPLVIFLHGSGERGSDNEAQLKWAFRTSPPIKIWRSILPLLLRRNVRLTSPGRM